MPTVKTWQCLLFLDVWAWLWMAGVWHPVTVSAAAETFPEGPITIIVYTGPGGLIDTTAQKFAEVARKHVPATFVVKHVPEGKGISAMKRLLDAPADGYTLYAGTKSNIAKAITSGKTHYLTSMHWLALLMTDPECLITRRNDRLSHWDDVLADARRRPGEQIWLGPDTGGLDHVMALRTWDAFGIEARWVPWDSGGAALTSLLGDKGDVYVGNPGEALGRDELRVALVSAAARLPEFPESPTLAEYGVPGMNEEFMWRGFAIKEGTPQQALDWYDRLFRQVTEDPEWRAFWERGGIRVTYRRGDAFQRIVDSDIQVFTHYLQKLNLIQTVRTDPFSRAYQRYGFWAGILSLALLNGGLLWGIRRHGEACWGPRVVPLNLLVLGVWLGAGTFTLPVTEGVGPAVVPRLWIVLLIPACLLLMRPQRGDGGHPLTGTARAPLERHGLAGRPPRFAGLLILYLCVLPIVGYHPATFVFLLLAMQLLGVHRWSVRLSVAAGWFIGAELVFVRFFQVALPAGWLWEI